MKISLATLGSVAIGITLTLVILSYDVGLSWSFGDENQTTDRIIAIALVWICIFVALGFWSLYVKERRETRHLEALVENANEGILLVSSTSIITNANYTAEKIFGYALGELRGRNLSLLLPADR